MLRFIGNWVRQRNDYPYLDSPSEPDRVKGDCADRVYYPRVLYHKGRRTVDVSSRFRLYGGVDNLADKPPPLGIPGTGSMGEGDPIHDNIGRFFYMGVTARF